MGTPVVPGEKGDDCPTCTPDIWAPGQTPKYLMVMLTGIIGSPLLPPEFPDPPNGDWILTQSEITPCLWNLWSGGLTFVYQTTAINTQLRIMFGPIDIVFISVVTEPCWAYFASSLVSGPGVPYAEGTAFIDLYDFPGTAYQLLHDYNLAPTEHTKFEVHEVPGEPPYVQVRRFGNVRTPTNIAIKTDATHKDQYEMFEA